MKGAAWRIGALGIAVCVIAGSARAADLEVTDHDRVWANFTREAAVVGDKHFWIEMRGMLLMDDQGIKQTDTNGVKFDGPTLNFAGYPVNKPHCTIGGTSPCIDSIDGGRFDLVGGYGLGPNAEVGLDLPFVMQEQIGFAEDPATSAGGGHENFANIGDLTLYGKFKRQLAEHWAGAIGLEINAASGSSSKGFGSGHTGLNPLLSTRYQSGRLALGAHVGWLFNVDGPADVFNWSLEGIVRGNALFALRCEVNGRQFRQFGDNFTDIAVWPGIDFNLTDYLTIRPEAEAHLTNDAINWGLGIGIAVTL
jgi:hypothetical protein